MTSTVAQAVLPTTYAALRATFDQAAPELSKETFDDRIRPDPMTLSFVILADHEARNDVQRDRNVSRLFDLKKDGGWGLPFDWDAFSDGTINKAGTPYTVTTALALLALVGHKGGDVFRAWPYCRGYDDETLFFPYSVRLEDTRFVVNVSSFMAGVMLRCHRVWDDPVRQRAVWALRTVLSQQDATGKWLYEVGRTAGNDAVHHALILWGLMLGDSLSVADSKTLLQFFDNGGAAIDFVGGHVPMQPWGRGLFLYLMSKLNMERPASLLEPQPAWIGTRQKAALLLGYATHERASK